MASRAVSKKQKTMAMVFCPTHSWISSWSHNGEWRKMQKKGRLGACSALARQTNLNASKTFSRFLARWGGRGRGEGEALCPPERARERALTVCASTSTPVPRSVDGTPPAVSATTRAEALFFPLLLRAPFGRLSPLSAVSGRTSVHSGRDRKRRWFPVVRSARRMAADVDATLADAPVSPPPPSSTGLRDDPRSREHTFRTPPPRQNSTSQSISLFCHFHSLRTPSNTLNPHPHQHSTCTHARTLPNLAPLHVRPARSFLLPPTPSSYPTFVESFPNLILNSSSLSQHSLKL